MLSTIYLLMLTVSTKIWLEAWPKKWNSVLKTLAIDGGSWANEEGRVIIKINLKPIAKVWVKFLKSRLMPTTHTTTVSQERLILLYVIVKGLSINVGAIIEGEIRECAMKKHKIDVLLFHSLATSICLVSGVSITAEDERIKNEGALTTRTIERIVGEFIVATPEPTVVASARTVIGVEMRLQELSDSITQCVEAQRR